jgi:hypothetical protein
MTCIVRSMSGLGNFALLYLFFIAGFAPHPILNIGTVLQSFGCHSGVYDSIPGP